jgi:hypothetical protein
VISTPSFFPLYEGSHKKTKSDAFIVKLRLCIHPFVDLEDSSAKNGGDCGSIFFIRSLHQEEINRDKMG